MAHDTYWGDRIASEDVVDPIVFHFKPTSYVQIDAEHRDEFEAYFRENIGFPPPPMNERTPSLAARWPYGGTSGSNGGWDD